MYQMIHLLGGEIIKSTLKNSFLFNSLNDAEFSRASDCFSGEVKTFERGEEIYSPNSFQRKIGFIISGECVVCRNQNSGGRVTLNTIFPGGSFGISTVFSKDDFPTVIFAKRRTSVVFLTQDELLHLMREFPAVALNIIRFQNERITFLNKKIETFSAGSAEKRLACYLLDELKSKGDTFVFNRKKTSELLGVGRASLYRALDTLIAKDILCCNDKKIYIKDPKGLERIVK